MPSALRLLVAATAGLLLGILPAQAANDPGAPAQWNMSLVGAESGWSGGGKGITIAIVDSGVDMAHEDLAGRVLPGQNFVTPNGSAQDDLGHGTHVAGIAAATTNNRKGVVGIAPQATLLPVKVFDKDGATSGTSVYDGIRWAADNGAHVINLSLSVALRTKFVRVPISDAELSSAVRYAWGKGVICVLSSGNDGAIASAFATEPGVVVTATTPQDQLAPYANDVGAARWGMAAPGGAGGDADEDDVLSTYWVASEPNQYAWAAGTSMAAPHVSGAAAVLRGLGLSPQQTVDRLLATARDLAPAGEDSRFGYGRLDVAKAVEGLVSASGGSGGTVPSGAVTTSTTARKASSGGSAAGATTSTAARKGTTTTTSVDAIGAEKVGTSAAGEGDGDGDGGDGVSVEELGAPEGSDPTGGDDGGGGNPVWPIAVLAAGALALVAWRAVRA
ncbi:MAG: S8 family serine peptidase, partial [Actinomycetota bacterium]|nr:S8 family serine peptidase [Actinomycetota bacterium]